MDLKKCEALLTAIDSGSLTKAAQILHYTPSGLSHMMHTLEQELGFALLYRHKNGVTPTPNAELLLPILREMADCANRFEQLSGQITGLERGRLTIGTYTSIATCWLPPILRAFAQAHPGIRIILKEGIHQELDDMLANHKVDLCFYSENPNSPYPWVFLRKDPMIAVLPCHHALAQADAYPIAACEKEDFIMPAYGADHDVLQLFAAYQIQPNIKYETIENHAALAMIAEGLGMSIMNQLITQGHTANVVKLPLAPAYSIAMGAALPCDAAPSPAALAFLELAKAHLAIPENPQKP